MEPRDDIPEEHPEIDVQSLKRAIMRRDEAVERFRAAKAQMMRGRAAKDAKRQEQAPHPGERPQSR
jgi:hypothetical protein